MQLLPKTLPSTYLQIKKFKGPKVDHFHFHFTFIINFCRVVPRTSLSTINFCRVVPRTSLATTSGVGGRQRGWLRQLQPSPPDQHSPQRTSALSLRGWGARERMYEGEYWSGGVGQSCLSRPRYQPPTPMVVDSVVRGTTLQKFIVDSEVRGTTLQKLIVDSKVRGTTLQKLIRGYKPNVHIENPFKCSTCKTSAGVYERNPL